LTEAIDAVNQRTMQNGMFVPQDYQIVIDSGRRLTQQYTISLVDALPTIQSFNNVEITNAGRNAVVLQRDASATRYFSLLTMQTSDRTDAVIGLTFSGGQFPGGVGGGLALYGSGTALVSGCAFLNNEATEGGGLAAMEYSRQVTVRYCLFSGNVASSANGDSLGGAIFAISGTLAITGHTDITGNRAKYGGGIVVTGTARLLLDDGSSVTGNGARQNGGGIYLDADSQLAGNPAGNIITAQITGNYANSTSGKGGGIFIAPDARSTAIVGSGIQGNVAYAGAGVFHAGKAFVLSISGSVLSGNVAVQAGGGLYVDGARAWIAQSLIVRNYALNGGAVFQAPGSSVITTIASLASNTMGLGGGEFVSGGAVLGLSSSTVNNDIINVLAAGLVNCTF
jgi:hypothetical protein